MMNCTPPGGPLDAENDIVGPGALAAFFATAAITYLTVIGAYITGTLDEDLLNPFDQKFVGVSRRIVPYFKPKVQLLRRNASSTNARNGEHFSDTRQNAGKDAISNFLVSLSDQQLVTGLAILIAAVSGQASISTYDFYIALGLGWFSCTTHLATINVLCVRFKRQPYIREFRVSGLLYAMALLSYAFYTAMSVRDFSIPVRCPNNAVAGVGMTWFGIPTIVVLFPMWFDYLAAAQTLYLGTISLWDILEGAVLKLKGQNLRPLRKLKDLKVQEKTERVEKIVQKSSVFVQTRLGLLFYEGSFLATLPGITYSFCFGIAQIVQLRWRRSVELSDESTEMGFGQITTVLLLILPFMSIGEAFVSYRENRRSTTWTYEAVSIAKASAEESHELVADPQHDARSQTDDLTARSETSRHQPLEQSSRVEAGLLGERLDPDNRASLERNPSLISNRSRQPSHEFAPTEFQNEFSQYCQNIKDIEKYFPLAFRALPSLSETPGSLNARVSLLRRYMLVKSAEKTLSMKIPLIIFALHMCLGILAASFLNSLDSELVEVGILVILILMVLRFYNFLFHIRALVTKFRRTQV